MKIQILKIELEFYNRIWADRNFRSIYLCRVYSIFHFFGQGYLSQSDQKTKKLAVIFRQNADFYTENKQTRQLIFPFLVTLTEKRKME